VDRLFETERLFAGTEFSIEGQEELERGGTRYIEYNSIHERQREIVQLMQGECMYLGKVPSAWRRQQENCTPD